MIGYYCSSMVIEQTLMLYYSFIKTAEFNTCCVVAWLIFRLICKKHGRNCTVQLAKVEGATNYNYLASEI